MDNLDEDYIAYQFLSNQDRIIIYSQCEAAVYHTSLIDSHVLMYDKLTKSYQIMILLHYRKFEGSGNKLRARNSAVSYGDKIHVPVNTCKVHMTEHQMVLTFQQDQLEHTFAKQHGFNAIGITEILLFMRDHDWKLPFLESLIENSTIGLK